MCFLVYGTNVYVKVELHIYVFVFSRFYLTMLTTEKFNYLPFDGSGNPSSVHEICGVGFPAAEHFKLTAGPGCKVCSIKLYSRTGGASVNTHKKTKQ